MTMFGKIDPFRSRGFASALVCALIFLAPASHAVESVVCEGDIPVFGFFGDRLVTASSKEGRFHGASQDISRIAIGLDPKKPLVEVLPWGEITPKVFSERFAREGKIAYQSDGESFFTVALELKATRVFRPEVRCQVGPDFTSGFAPSREPTSQKKSRSRSKSKNN